jgi:hypothetical protein
MRFHTELASEATGSLLRLTRDRIDDRDVGHTLSITRKNGSDHAVTVRPAMF